MHIQNIDKKINIGGNEYQIQNLVGISAKSDTILKELCEKDPEFENNLIQSFQYIESNLPTSCVVCGLFYREDKTQENSFCEDLENSDAWDDDRDDEEITPAFVTTHEGKRKTVYCVLSTSDFSVQFISNLEKDINTAGKDGVFGVIAIFDRISPQTRLQRAPGVPN